MVNLVANPAPLFLDSSGNALNTGSAGGLYIGVANVDPTKNPVTVYQDDELSIPFAQPLQVVNGAVSLNGSPRQVFTSANVFSLAAFDQSGSLVLSMPEVSAVGQYPPITSMVPKIYKAGTDFNPGTSTTLTLPSDPGSPDNVLMFFDGVFQSPDQIQSVAYPTLTLTGAIPQGTNEVVLFIGATFSVGTVGTGTVTDASVAAGAGIESTKLSYNEGSPGAVTRTIQARLQDWVSVKDFGATGNGTTDDTAAIQTAINTASAVFIPDGTYAISALTIPAACLAFIGQSRSGVTFIPKSGRVSGSPMITLSSTAGGQYGNFGFSGATALTDSLVTATSDNGSDIFGIQIPSAGGIGIALTSCTDTRLHGCFIEDHGVVASTGGQGIDANTCTHVEIFNNHVTSQNANAGTTINVAGGSFNDVHHNYCKRTSAFLAFCVEVITEINTFVHDNLLIPNLIEGFNFTDASNCVGDSNYIYCQTGHHDFGCSINAATVNCNQNKITNNFIFAPGSSGVGVASTPTTTATYANLIANNMVINPCGNRGGTPAAAFLIYGNTGNTSVDNVFQNNAVYDSNGIVNYVCYEAQGARNTFKDNYGLGGAIQTENVVTGTGSRAWDMMQTTFTPAISSSGGAITSSTEALQYSRRGHFMDVQIGVTITNNGTGSGFLNIQLPFACNGTLVTRDTGVSGAVCAGVASGGTTLSVANYNGAYPVATGSVLNFSGTLELV